MELSAAQLREAVAAAAAAGIELCPGPALPRTGDFRSDPRLDFGKHLHREPAFVLRPADRAQLAACLRLCAALHIPVVTRGTAHSAGGQALSAGGCLLDLTRLCRVGAPRPDPDRPGAHVLDAEGGATWRAILQALRPAGLRPVVLTDNLGTTLGGTLSVGGIGDTSLHHGLQASHVRSLTLCTMAGELRTLTPADQALGYVLAGRGQLGVLVAATLGTLRRPAPLAGRVLRWRSVDRFVEGALRARAAGTCEFFRATLLWPEDGGPCTVQAIAGDFADAGPAPGPEPDAHEAPDGGALAPDEASPLEVSDRYQHVLLSPPADPPHWRLPCVPLEAVLPWPDGAAALEHLCARVVASGLHRAMPLGAALALLPRDPHLALAPQSRAAMSLVLALRPLFPGPAAATACIPLLRSLIPGILDAGGRLYPCGLEPQDPEQRRRQLGPGLDTLRRLKQQFDPQNLLNSSLLQGL